jgi:hypothetical protein
MKSAGTGTDTRISRTSAFLWALEQPRKLFDGAADSRKVNRVAVDLEQTL